MYKVALATCLKMARISVSFEWIARARLFVWQHEQLTVYVGILRNFFDFFLGPTRIDMICGVVYHHATRVKRCALPNANSHDKLWPHAQTCGGSGFTL
jgi:hypothetical protein